MGMMFVQRQFFFFLFGAICVRKQKSVEWGSLYLYLSVPFTAHSESEQHKLILLWDMQHEIAHCCCCCCEWGKNMSGPGKSYLNVRREERIGLLLDVKKNKNVFASLTDCYQKPWRLDRMLIWERRKLDGGLRCHRNSSLAERPNYSIKNDLRSYSKLNYCSNYWFYIIN